MKKIKKLTTGKVIKMAKFVLKNKGLFIWR